MRSYRKHLSGEAAFKSFVPTPLSEIQVIHTEELDKLIMETESGRIAIECPSVEKRPLPDVQ